MLIDLTAMGDDERGNDDECHFETTRVIHPHIRQIFEDMVRRNRTHWDPVDFENFLATEGNLVHECIAPLEPGPTEAIAALLADEETGRDSVALHLICMHCKFIIDNMKYSS